MERHPGFGGGERDLCGRRIKKRTFVEIRLVEVIRPRDVHVVEACNLAATANVSTRILAGLVRRVRTRGWDTSTRRSRPNAEGDRERHERCGGHGSAEEA